MRPDGCSLLAASVIAAYNSPAAVFVQTIDAMSQLTLDQRVAALEQEVARLSRLLPGESRSPKKDWRSTLGMFAGDPVMKEIIEEGRKIRERDREQAGE
jgi:hypothetical protein